MKKENYRYYDYCRRLVDRVPVVPVIDDEFVEKSQSPSDSLLSIVYAMDERTHLPIGDLTYLVSDKANPQVKEFILANLMQDVSVAKNIAADANLSDDDILALSMNKDESVESYAQRLNDSISRDKWLMNEYTKSVSSDGGPSPVPSE